MTGNNKLLLAVLFAGAVLCCLHAPALVVVLEETWTFEDVGDVPDPYVLDSEDESPSLFRLFDENYWGAELKKVEIEFTAYYDGSVDLENTDTDNNTIALGLSGEDLANLAFTGGDTIFDLDPSLDPLEDPIDNEVTLAPGEIRTVGLRSEATATQTYTDPADLVGFEGPNGDTFSLTLTAFAHQFQAISTNGKSFTDFYGGNVGADVTVRHFVPEPASGLILLFASLAAFRRRR